jgi:hypothetical protein
MPLSRNQRGALFVFTFALLLCFAARVACQTSHPPPPDGLQEIERNQGSARRIPQQRPISTAALQGIVLDAEERPLAGVMVRLVGGTSPPSAQTAADGIFRLVNLQPGTYDLFFSKGDGGQAYLRSNVRLLAGEVLSVKIHLRSYTGLPSTAPIPQQPAELDGEAAYQTISRRPDAEGAIVPPKELELPAERKLYTSRPDRWHADFPSYHRYPGNGDLEAPFVLGHWYDPFNRNRLKGDIPIRGQKTFFSFTGDSITAIDGRRLPVPSGQSTARSNESPFFGRGGEFFLAQTFRLTFDLFHGDTNAFRPVDWRLRITPAANLNYIRARENQVISADVRAGTARIDGHVGLQEAFGEVKLRDLGPNYDFINLRIGIQQFVSDFRGLIFTDEQPGARLFGNLRSNRLQYNLAAFDLLEKNTNSGLNTLSRRSREVAIANVFIQDFFAKGYTGQFSYHFQRDNATVHYDDNGFLVRPAPIGTVVLDGRAITHRIDAHYFGWTGDGHIGRTNINHAFYQVLGEDTFNPIAAHYVDLNAQLAELELSRDMDWLRFRASFLFASGEKNIRGNTAHGFDSIVDAESFAGGEFSFFNRESIRLTGTGVALNSGDSFLPDLRSSKDEGQSNFINPGLFLYNAGADAKLTQTIKLIGNVNFLQFVRTEPLIFLQQQAGIRRTIGVDSSVGVIYRPLLSDNIVVTAGTAVLAPGRGLRDIYNSHTLISGFGTVRFQF